MKMRKPNARTRFIDAQLSAICDAIERGCGEESMQEFVCPVCGAKIAIVFEPTGKAYAVGCSTNPEHGGLMRYVRVPPMWWRKYPTGRLRNPPLRE